MTYVINDPVYSVPAQSVAPIMRAMNFSDAMFYFSGESQDGHLDANQKLTSIHDVSKGRAQAPFLVSNDVRYIKQRTLSNELKALDCSDASLFPTADGIVLPPQFFDGLIGITVGMIYDTLVSPVGVNQDIVSLFVEGSNAPVFTAQIRTNGVGLAVANWNNPTGTFMPLYSANNSGGSTPGWRAALLSYNYVTGAAKIRKNAGSYTEGVNTNLGTGTSYAKASGFGARLFSRTGQNQNRYQGLLRDLVVIPRYLTYDDAGDGQFLWDNVILPELARMPA